MCKELFFFTDLRTVNISIALVMESMNKELLLPLASRNDDSLSKAWDTEAYNSRAISVSSVFFYKTLSQSFGGLSK